MQEGVTTYYLAVNRNKRSVALDLKDEDDRAAAGCARAHVVVENFKPGGLAHFGLGYCAMVAPAHRGVHLDQRVWLRQGRRPARIRPDGATISVW